MSKHSIKVQYLNMSHSIRISQKSAQIYDDVILS